MYSLILGIFTIICLATSNSIPSTEDNLRGHLNNLEGSISEDHQDIKRAPMRFGKRAPMRFGKREFDEELNEFKILRSARAPMRFGKRSDTTKRAPMRFGKRAPMRFGKRDYEAPSFMNYYNDDYVVREDYI